MYPLVPKNKGDKVIVCIKCDAEYDLDTPSDVCIRCGTKIRYIDKYTLKELGYKVCESCGNPVRKENEEFFKFCPYCGTKYDL